MESGASQPFFFFFFLQSVWGGGGRARGRGFEEVEESFESGRCRRSARCVGRLGGDRAIGSGDLRGEELASNCKLDVAAVPGGRHSLTKSSDGWCDRESELSKHNLRIFLSWWTLWKTADVRLVKLFSIKSRIFLSLSPHLSFSFSSKWSWQTYSTSSIFLFFLLSKSSLRYCVQAQTQGSRFSPSPSPSVMPFTQDHFINTTQDSWTCIHDQWPYNSRLYRVMPFHQAAIL